MNIFVTLLVTTQTVAFIDKQIPAGLLIGIRQHGMDQLKDKFFSVADPASSDFEERFSKKDLANIVASETESIRAIKVWLSSIGANMTTFVLHPIGDSAFVSWPPGVAETKAPSIPHSLFKSHADYVLLIKPTVNIVADAPENERRLPQVSNSMGPNEQKAAYGVPLTAKGTNETNLQMVFGTGTFGFRSDDLQLFYDTYAHECKVKDVTLDTDNKWKGKTGKNYVEGMLDASYITAFAPGVKTIVANPDISAATEGGEAYGAALLAFLVDLNARDTVPYVLSMSLGSLSFGACDKLCKKASNYKSCEAYLQTQFQACMFSSAALEKRTDAEFAKLGLRGTTVITASGDGGSHFAFGPFGKSELNEIICKGLNMPVYPADSAFVLSIGGLQWTSDDMYGPECSKASPCGWSSGGGGFAWTAGAAAYQGDTTAKYIKLATQVGGKFMTGPTTYNASGRGYPDFATLAQFGIPLCTYGGCSGSGGTSASAPTVAGMLSLINDERLNAGQPTLGFINTRLYKMMQDPAVYAECFTDVGIEKVGSLWDCDTFTTCEGCTDQNKGFVATKGWDAQTGFGQPKFMGLKKHLGTSRVYH